MILPPMSTMQEKSMRFEKARAGILPGISSTHPMKRFILECLSVGPIPSCTFPYILSP